MFKTFADDCLLPEGICFHDEMGMPMAKHLKPDVVTTVFARSINYLEPTSRPVFEKRQQKLVSCYIDNIGTSLLL